MPNILDDLDYVDVGIEDEDLLDDYHAFVGMCPQPIGAPPVSQQFMKGYWAASQLSTEASEVLELFEKSYRKGIVLDIDRLEDELGDALWGITCIANTYGLTLQDIINHNMNKLEERNRGKITKVD